MDKIRPNNAKKIVIYIAATLQSKFVLENWKPYPKIDFLKISAYLHMECCTETKRKKNL